MESKKEKPHQKKKRGIKKKIQSQEDLFKYFEEYREFAKSNPFKIKDWVGKDGKEVQREKERALTMVGFENYCAQKGYIRDLKDYFSNDDNRYNDYQQACSMIKNIILQDQIEGGLSGMYHHGLTARINGISDNKNSTITATVKQITGMKIE